MTEYIPLTNNQFTYFVIAKNTLNSLPSLSRMLLSWFQQFDLFQHSTSRLLLSEMSESLGLSNGSQCSTCCGWIKIGLRIMLISITPKERPFRKETLSWLALQASHFEKSLFLKLISYFPSQLWTLCFGCFFILKLSHLSRGPLPPMISLPH